MTQLVALPREADFEEIPIAATDPKFGATELHHHISAPGPELEGGVLEGKSSLGDRRWVTAALMMVMVLASMEQTVTSTAMPTIIGDLQGLEHYAWVASIYLLCSTVSMPVYGRLADAWGRRIMILGAIIIFTIGSLFAANAHSMTQLIIFRGMQGLGAGGIMPVVLTILGDIYTLEERAGVQGLFSSVWGTASLAGPALGALLVRTLGWRSIFYVNLPFGVLGLFVMVWKYRDRQQTHKVDLDLPGAALLSVLCVAVLLFVTRVGPQSPAWATLWPMGLLIASVVSGIWFFIHERGAANPILPPSFLTHPTIGTSLLGGCLMGVTFLSIDTYVPLYVQGGRGGGAAGAAAVVTPVMLTWAISGIFSAPMVVRWGFRRTCQLGSTLILIGVTGLLLCTIFDAPQWALTGVLAITGFGFGPTSMSYLLSAQEVVDWRQRGLVTSNVMFSRTIGGALGIGALGGLLTTLIQPGLAALHARNVSPNQIMDERLRNLLPPDVLVSLQHVIVHSLAWVFATMLAVAVAGLFVTLRIPNNKAKRKLTAAETAEAMAA